MIDRIVFAILSAGCTVASSVWLIAAYNQPQWHGTDKTFRNVGIVLLVAALVFAGLAIFRRREPAA
jgi:hypothetical protein